MADAVHIVDDDATYLSWLDANCEGWVVNTRKRIDPGYFVLHRADCNSIRMRDDTLPGAFTERGYSKIVAGTMEALQEFMETRGIGAFSKRCSQCN